MIWMVSSLRPATISPSSLSNRQRTAPGVPSRSTWNDSVVRVNRVLLLNVRFKAFLSDSLPHLFHRHPPPVERDTQQIAVPFIPHQFNAWKPYQGLFHPIGSVLSHQRQPLAHVLDMERHGFDARFRRRRRRGRTAATREQHHC
jgi:hypothetical protein